MEQKDQENGPTSTAEVSYNIEAKPETVWDILITPARFSNWMGGEITFEAQAKSAFRANFPSFSVLISGEVVAVDADAYRLTLTWGAETGPQAATMPPGSTEVVFRICPTDTGCQVDISHSGFATPQLVGEHEGGWRFHLSRLALFANRADLTAGLERTLPYWYRAWSETAKDKRLELLRACCAEDIVFRDDWAVAEGVERLSEHIGNCHHYMPGWTMEAGGDLRVCRGRALADWRAIGPEGKTGTGWNSIRANPDGTIRSVTGFAGR